MSEGSNPNPRPPFAEWTTPSKRTRRDMLCGLIGTLFGLLIAPFIRKCPDGPKLAGSAYDPIGDIQRVRATSRNRIGVNDPYEIVQESLINTEVNGWPSKPIRTICIFRIRPDRESETGYNVELVSLKAVE